MKRTNKKGFTIVELVVVIAVIAILAAVMIPTFSGVTQNAKDAARDQEAKSIYSQYLGNWDYQNDGEPAYDCYVAVVEDDVTYYYVVNDGNLDVDQNPVTAIPYSCYNDSDSDGIYICTTNHQNHTPVSQ